MNTWRFTVQSVLMLVAIGVTARLVQPRFLKAGESAYMDTQIGSVAVLWPHGEVRVLVFGDSWEARLWPLW